MKLIEKVNDLEARLLGNRCLVLGAALVGGGTYEFFMSSLSVSDKEPLNLIASITSSLTAIIGSFLIGFNTCGIDTYKSYKRTIKHIEQFGEIMPDFFIKYIGQDNGHFMGYCQLQGMYLAARKNGKLESFYRNRKEYSKCLIPNF